MTNDAEVNQYREILRKAHRAMHRRVAGIARLLKAEWTLRGWRRTGRVPVTVPESDRVVVIFCTWKRIERLPHTLEMLAQQDLPVQALIWNNSPDRAFVDESAASAPIPVSVQHSPRNIGGFGRFYLAREAALAGHEAVVFIDDDQDFGSRAVGELLEHHTSRSLSGWWAFRLPKSDFWHQEAPEPGDTASYVGTGGMVVDTAVFKDPRLFLCPRRFWFAEDIWLCYFANHVKGYRLFRSPADSFELVYDGLDQFPSLSFMKDGLMRYVLRHGWELPG